MKRIILIFSFILCAFSVFAAISPVVSTQDTFGIRDIIVTQDGSAVIAAVDDGTVRIFEASSGRHKSTVKMPASIRGMALTDNSNKLLVAADRLYLMNMADGAFSGLSGSASAISALAADNAGRTAVTSTGSTINFISIMSGRVNFSTRTPSEIYALAVDDLTQVVYAGGRDGTIRSYSMTTGSLISQKAAGIGVIRSIDTSSVSVIAGGESGARLFNKQLDELKRLDRHMDVVRSVKITPDGRFAVSGGDDGIPIAWNLAGDSAVSSPLLAKQRIMSVAVDPYFRYIVAGGSVPGETGGMFAIHYTANKNEVRNVYAFRDATLTLNLVGYSDGSGPFSKYLSYEEGSRRYSFDEVAHIVNIPGKLNYSMPRPGVAARDLPQPVSGSAGSFVDTTPPVITVNVRGFAPVAPSEIRTVEGSITDESGVAWAKIDGRALRLSSGGNFSAEFVASSNRNIIISAADIYGNAAETTVALAANSPSVAGDGRKVALIIGINYYRHLPSLTTPEYDSRAVAEVLRAKYGYETTLLLGSFATRDAILTEISNLRQKLTDKDRLIIYYAGHGELDSASGNAYWQPYDAMPGNDARWILTSQVTSTLSAFASPVLVISDSCYSGALRSSGGIGQGRLTLISGGGDEPVADIGGGGHSVFAAALLKTFDSKLSSSRLLFEGIMSAIGENSGQTPEYHVLSGNSDFVF